MEQIVAVCTHTEKTPPLRAYVFDSAVRNKCVSDPNRHQSIWNAVNKDLLPIIYDSNMLNIPQNVRRRNYIIAFLQKQGGSDIVDIFGYHGISNWKKCNPEVCYWQFNNGIYLPAQRDICCETEAIILGREGEHRRSTKCRHDYMIASPVLDDLMPREVAPKVVKLFSFRE